MLSDSPKVPVTNTLLDGSQAMLLAVSDPLPAPCTIQPQFPCASSLTTNRSVLLCPYKGVDPKYAIPSKIPDTYTFDKLSVAMLKPLSSYEPPALLAQTGLPFASNLAIRISRWPLLVRVVVPIVTLPV